MSDLPYFSTLSSIPKYFNKIKDAEAPEKFDYKFLKDILGFKSGNDQRVVAVLRSMKFIDSSGLPLKYYHDFRAETIPSKSIAKGLKEAYKEIFSRNVTADIASIEEIKNHVISITRRAATDRIVANVTGSFMGLKSLSDFKALEKASELTEEEKQNLPANIEPKNTNTQDMKLTYTIVLNLPATTTKEVYDTLFSSLKENLLKN